MKLILIRHGLTEWNVEKRIQGRIDQPLSKAGIEQIGQYRLPDTLHQMPWYCSPMQRARQTAELLHIDNPVIEGALTEMNWGDWEGKVLKPLRKQLGSLIRDNEARGLDFCPPNGESPRQVQNRLAPWLQAIAEQGSDCGAVVHKGIIRCVYAMAYNWDMRGESPVEFDWSAAHEFEIDDSGGLNQYYRTSSLTSRPHIVRASNQPAAG